MKPETFIIITPAGRFAFDPERVRMVLDHHERDMPPPNVTPALPARPASQAIQPHA